MSLHRVRLFYSGDTDPAFNDWLETWLTNMEPWADHDNQVPELTRNAYPESQPYFQTNPDLIFEWSESKSIIVDNIAGYLDAYAPWYQLYYHICDHDEDSEYHCGWALERDGGTVPDWVVTP